MQSKFDGQGVHYDELVYQQVCPGNTGSSQLEVFKAVLVQVWDILKLSAGDKNRVLIRLDSGYGTTAIINHLWSEGYQFITKIFATSRARKLGREVDATVWQADSCHSGRGATQLEGQPPLHRWHTQALSNRSPLRIGS